MSNSRERRGKDCCDDKKYLIPNAINGIQKTLNSCCCCIIRKLDELINQQKLCLCVTNSVCVSAEEGDASISASIPANSCITNIYTSGSAEANFDSILVTINNGTENIFCQRFYLQTQGANFETNLVKPLCVGPQEATVTATFEGGTIDEGLLTVVYCEDCCGVE
ncbi:MAG: hypothetical protein GX327_08885 [Epulopiscium sp.]|mgnify:CR=1 FL=1|nr:hypothetical protein [Candidatus Epulonipiscium sp.]